MSTCIGQGIGIPFSRVLGGILPDFRNRVVADGGTIEAESCLQTTISQLQAQGLYDKASLIVTPNAYKASKIYSLKPTNGAGDLTFARGGAGSRRNSSGVFESLANNVPPLHYPIGGGCPSLAIQPQRTNIFLNPESPTTQNITVVSGQVYTITTWGTVTATCSGAGVGVASDNGSFTFTASSTTLSVTISGLSGQAYVNVGLGASNWITPIMSGAVSTTRSKDFIAPFNVSSYVGASSGTFFIDMFSPIQGQANGNINISLGTNSDTLSGSQFWIRQENLTASFLRVFSRISGVNIIRTTFTQDRNKVSISWDGTTAILHVNGILITSFAWTATAMHWFGIDPNVSQLINMIMFFPLNLTNAENADLTTI